MGGPIIVNFTPTGMLPTKGQTPHVPVSPSEVVEEVHRAVEMGITIAHLHARDAQGLPTHEAEVYGRIIEGIRAFAPDLILCVSLSGRSCPEPEKRMEPLRLDGNLKPDMGSLTLASLNFSRQASLNAPDTVQALAVEMKRRGILPELEVFDLGMVNFAKYLLRKGLLSPPHHVNIILGNVASAQCDLGHAGMILRDLPDDCAWAFGGIGEAQLPATAVAIAMGGGARVGLEDNLYYDRDRRRLASNMELLKRVHDLAALLDRKVAPPAQARALLNLEPGRGAYSRKVSGPVPGAVDA